jgi:inosose dehydratase
MELQGSRRRFLQCMGALAVATAQPSHAAFALFKSSDRIRFGYAAMTWGDKERQAIDDIEAVGFPGIQFRANAVTEFKAAELRDILH